MINTQTALGVTALFVRKTRNFLNGYIATAGGVQETELNAQNNKHCSAKCEKKVKVSNG